MHRYPMRGDHPDTEALAYAIKDNIITFNNSDKLSLGLVHFSGGVPTNQVAASCASCASMIEALSENYKISVLTHTPYNFPSDKNFSISPIILNDDKLIERYIVDIKDKADKILYSIGNDEKANYIRYSTYNEVLKIKRNGEDKQNNDKDSKEKS